MAALNICTNVTCSLHQVCEERNFNPCALRGATGVHLNPPLPPLAPGSRWVSFRNEVYQVPDGKVLKVSHRIPGRPVFEIAPLNLFKPISAEEHARYPLLGSAAEILKRGGQFFFAVKPGNETDPAAVHRLVMDQSGCGFPLTDYGLDLAEMRSGNFRQYLPEAVNLARACAINTFEDNYRESERLVDELQRRRSGQSNQQHTTPQKRQQERTRLRS